MREILPYNPMLKETAKELRKNMTLTEILFWKRVNKKQCLGYDFDRQKPILNYVVDFYCKDLKLAIEIDGQSHNHEDIYVADKMRQEEIEKLGVTFLRFKNEEILQNLNSVIEILQHNIKQLKPTP